MSAPALEAHDLVCAYGDRPILGPLSFALPDGELVGILGPNGVGKSTLLRALAGMLVPASGVIELGGRNLATYGPRDLALERAYMPQMPEVEAAWTVAEVVGMGRYPRQPFWGLFQGAGDAEAIHTAMQATEVLALADRAVSSLSGGQRQRVHLARTLAQQAPLLLLDEPTSALDLAHQIAFAQLLRGVCVSPDTPAKRPLTVVVVLHDLNLAAQFCDRLLVLAHPEGASVQGLGGGQPASSAILVADGSPEAILTPALVSRTYGVAVRVSPHPETGRPYVVPTLVL